jgi:hypothetical protein
MWAKVCLVLLMACSNACLACSCQIPEIQKPAEGSAANTEKQDIAQEAAWYSRRATTVLRATVVRRSHFGTDAPARSGIADLTRAMTAPKQSPYEHRYELSVMETFKGADGIGPKVIMTDYLNPCGMTIKPGEEWILFLDGDKPLSQCSGNTEVTDARMTSYRLQMLTALRDAKADVQRRLQVPLESSKAKLAAPTAK